MTPRPPIPRPAVRNSFGKAMILMVVGMVPVLVLVLTSGKSPEQSGYLFGYYSASFIMSGVIIGVWAKLSKRSWTWPNYIVRFALVAVVIFVLALFGSIGGIRESRVVTDAEKQHLVLNGTEVRHSDFGFVVPLPSADFQFSADLQRTANQEFSQRGVADQTYSWVLIRPAPREVIMLMVSKGIGNSEAALRGLGRGLRRGASGQGVQVLEDTMEWVPKDHEYRFAATTSQGIYVRARCMSSSTTPTSVSYILCVQTVSAASTGLDEARAGARVASWP